MPKEIKARYNLDAEQTKQKEFESLLAYLDAGKINTDAVFELLIEIAKGRKIETLNISKYKPISDAELKKEVTKIITENKGASFNAVMGEIMKKYRGKVDGKKVADIIKDIIK